jgi:hypothetical protein
MAASVYYGTGTALATHGYAAELIDLQLSGMSREALETTHMTTDAGTIGGRTFMPPDYADPGEMTCTFHFDPDLTPPINSAAAGIVITFPEGDTFTVSGFMTSFEVNCPLEDIMTATATWKLSGNIVIA